VQAAKETEGDNIPEFLANFVEAGVWDVRLA
jgi:hypothetical protein